MYVHIKTEPTLWTVGFYDPSGRWQPESDWDNKEDAAKRVNFLNGGKSDIYLQALNKIARADEKEWQGVDIYGNPVWTIIGFARQISPNWREK